MSAVAGGPGGVTGGNFPPKHSGSSTPGSKNTNTSALSQLFQKKLGQVPQQQQSGQHVKEGSKWSSQRSEVLGELKLGNQPPINTARLKNVSAPSFTHVDSATLQNVPVKGGVDTRTDFLNSKQRETPPPIISRSEFVPDKMVEHLMRDKKDSALGIKYMEGDSITNMEGLMHTFVTPIGEVVLTGDYIYKYGHNATEFEKGKGRSIIMSFMIQPDFEKPDVMLKLTQLQNDAVLGAVLPENSILLDRKSKSNHAERQQYDEKLLKHMIYHLTEDHMLPGLGEVEGKIFDEKDGLKLLDQLIQNPDSNISIELKDKVIEVNGYPLSMEILFNVYVHLLRNELSVLEATCMQGYVYTIDPPAIFAQLLGVSDGMGAKVLNRFQAAAFCHLNKNQPFNKMKVLAFNDYRDKENLNLLQHIFKNSGTNVQKKSELFTGKDGTYTGPSGLALVLHNNSDAFGQNIETEGLSSMDGVMGTYSDAACVIKRSRNDLTRHMV